MYNILVTGATGFLGSAVVEALLVSNYRVLAVGRKKNGLISDKSFQNPKFSFLRYDILDKNFINSCNSFVTQGLKPSLTVILDLEWSKSNQRHNGQKDRMEENSDIFFNKISDGYRLLAEESPERYFLIDGTLTINEIHNLIWEKVKKEFNL